MNNLEESLKDLFDSEYATVFTGVMRDNDMMGLMTAMSMMNNQTISDRILSESRPMRSFGVGSVFVIGDTQRLISDSEYYNSFVAVCKESGLDNNFSLTFLGDALKKGISR